MNFKVVLKTLGIVLICEAFLMLPSLFVACLYRGTDIKAFLYSIAMCLVVGGLLALIKPVNSNIYAKDGFAIVALSWLLVSFFGTMPFYFSKSIPSFIDAFFETVSGFTTTGSSLLPNVEIFPKGILFWRSFTHWVGGMGVLVLTLAVLPTASAKMFHVMKAESPGPSPDKIVPKLGQTAKILYLIYFIMTIFLIVLLCAAGMPLYDACIHAFGTAGTGGFSNMNKSVGAYNNVYVDIILTVAMFMFSINISLYYQLLKGNVKTVFKNDELRFHVGIVITSIVLIAVNIHGKYFDSFLTSLRYSAFQVSSIVSTTGYATTDFNLWPTFSKAILFFLMFLGGCAGSTAGAMKNIRVLLLLKNVKREMVHAIHPRSYNTVRISGKAVDEKILSAVTLFFCAYMIIYVIAVLIVSTDGFDMETTLSSVAATLGNVGPGFGLVGPTGNFSQFSSISKIVFSIIMIIGRLEIFPLLLLFMPSFWKKVNI